MKKHPNEQLINLTNNLKVNSVVDHECIQYSKGSCCRSPIKHIIAGMHGEGRMEMFKIMISDTKYHLQLLHELLKTLNASKTRLQRTRPENAEIELKRKYRLLLRNILLNMYNDFNYNGILLYYLDNTKVNYDTIHELIYKGIYEEIVNNILTELDIVNNKEQHEFVNKSINKKARDMHIKLLYKQLVNAKFERPLRGSSKGSKSLRRYSANDINKTRKFLENVNRSIESLTVSEGKKINLDSKRNVKQAWV